MLRRAGVQTAGQPMPQEAPEPAVLGDARYSGLMTTDGVAASPEQGQVTACNQVDT